MNTVLPHLFSLVPWRLLLCEVHELAHPAAPCACMGQQDIHADHKSPMYLHTHQWQWLSIRIQPLVCGGMVWLCAALMLHAVSLLLPYVSFAVVAAVTGPEQRGLLPGVLVVP
jgi:hypothetical protein